jgi:ribose/xylose/arabinose/galactoside ABC-type transport system permease subunit
MFEKGGRKMPKISAFLGKYGIYIVFILVCIIMSLGSPAFMTRMNVLNVLRQVSINGIIAIGMTFVIITGGIDLSVGSVLGLSSIVMTSFALPGQSIPIAIMIGVLVGLACGLFNGITISYGGVPPFIATLGMLTVARGLTFLYNDGRPIIGLSDEYTAIGSGVVAGIPVPVIMFLIVAILGFFMLKFTKFGRHIYAVGGNELAAQVSGINTKRVKTLVYLICGGLASISGLILSSRVMTGSPVAGEGFELDAIAAVVIGGASLSGGIGSIPGTIVGTLLIGVMSNGLDLLRVSSYYQNIAKGAIIIIAVLIDVQTKKKNKK